MVAAYTTTINYEQSPKVLREILEEAVDRYLSLQPKVFPVRRQASSVLLKVQKSYRSNGELITVAILDGSFEIVSQGVAEPSYIAWGKNRNNVVALSHCIKDVMRERSQNLASLAAES